MGVAYPPPPELFCPSGLLGGFTLEVLGSGSAERSYDRIEVAVDAELGILLRRIETSGASWSPSPS